MINHLTKASIALFSLLMSAELVEAKAKSLEFLKEKDATGMELRHFIGAHFMKRFTVSEGTANFQTKAKEGWVDSQIRDFQLKPMLMENSFTKKADDLNGITLRISVGVSGGAFRKKNGRNWEDWQPSNPVIMTFASVTIVKRNGVFELTESLGAEQIRVKDVRPNKGIRRE